LLAPKGTPPDRIAKLESAFDAMGKMVRVLDLSPQ
jgi:hypothetical protein